MEMDTHLLDGWNRFSRWLWQDKPFRCDALIVMSTILQYIDVDVERLQRIEFIAFCSNYMYIDIYICMIMILILNQMTLDSGFRLYFCNLSERDRKNLLIYFPYMGTDYCEKGFVTCNDFN